MATSPSSVPPPPVSGDLPPTVITSSVKVSSGRPTPSWAAALVALGVFAGLVTAVLARGDGDALLHAGAQLVDPSQRAAAAAQMPAVVQPTAVAVAQPPVSNPPAVSTPAPAKISCAEETKPVVVNETKGLDVTAPKPEKQAAASKPAPQVVASKPVVKPAVLAPKVDAPVVAAAPKPSVARPAPKKAADDDSAAAADALAKAQLEAALGH